MQKTTYTITKFDVRDGDYYNPHGDFESESYKEALREYQRERKHQEKGTYIMLEQNIWEYEDEDDIGDLVFFKTIYAKEL